MRFLKVPPIQPAHKLDGISPVENRPFSDYLLQFLKKKKYEEKNVTCDKGHVAHDKWQVGGGEPSLKMSDP